MLPTLRSDEGCVVLLHRTLASDHTYKFGQFVCKVVCCFIYWKELYCYYYNFSTRGIGSCIQNCCYYLYMYEVNIGLHINLGK